MILVTGANGQLCQCFRQLAAQWPQYRFDFLGASDLDVSDRKAVAEYFACQKPRWAINCAAYTAVDKAESEPELAHKANVLGPRNLALACAAHRVPLIHFSTDYVYHSRQNTPFREGDRVSPKGVYARTKLAGERAAVKACPDLTMIVRTSWLYSEHGHNFVKTMLRLGSERPELRVVADQIGSPTYAPDLAAAVLQIVRMVESGKVPPTAIAGIWHYANEGVASWYDFAQAIFDIRQVNCKVVPISTSDYPTPAPRPAFSVLDKSKIKLAFGVEVPYWRDSLRRCLGAKN
jgi:dTDP-4-dehydrorhamnose reductase